MDAQTARALIRHLKSEFESLQSRNFNVPDEDTLGFLLRCENTVAQIAGDSSRYSRFLIEYRTNHQNGLNVAHRPYFAIVTELDREIAGGAEPWLLNDSANSTAKNELDSTSQSPTDDVDLSLPEGVVVEPDNPFFRRPDVNDGFDRVEPTKGQSSDSDKVTEIVVPIDPVKAGWEIPPTTAVKTPAVPSSKSTEASFSGGLSATLPQLRSNLSGEVSLPVQMNVDVAAEVVRDGHIVPVDEDLKLAGGGIKVGSPTVRGTGGFSSTGVADQAAAVNPIGAKHEFRRDAQAHEECLRVDDYATVLAALFATAPDDARFCFGLFGHWGRGKTFLMEKVCKKLRNLDGKSQLRDNGKRAHYHRHFETINFSAWKYRTTPEAWAYLYETIYATALRGCRFIPVWLRFKITSMGANSAIVAVWMLWFFLWPVTAKAQIIALSISAIGLTGLLWIVSLYLSTRKFGDILKSHYLASGRHRDKLGLQAAIGDDLKCLLNGWILRDYWQLITLLNVSRLVVYLTGVLFVANQLWPDKMPEHPARSFVSHLGADPLHLYLVQLLAYSFWCALCVPLPLVMCLGNRVTHVLLIVDDLDRCHHLQILEIIESVMLLLDDDDIGKRLQICMLIDESSFYHAINEKYASLALQLGSCETDRTRHEQRIARENLEKFFLSHLRLPPIDDSDLEELMKAFTKSTSADANSNVSVDTATPHDQPISTDTIREAPIEAPVKVELAFDEALTFAPEERFELLQIASKLRESSYAGTWGPRSMRCLIFRYQLARALLRQIKHPFFPADLVRELVRSRTDQGASDEAHDSTLRRIVSHVS